MQQQLEATPFYQDLFSLTNATTASFTPWTSTQKKADASCPPKALSFTVQNTTKDFIKNTSSPTISNLRLLDMQLHANMQAYVLTFFVK